MITAKMYISDKACRYGGHDKSFVRYISNDNCVLCARRLAREAYYANANYREAVKQRSRVAYEVNRDDPEFKARIKQRSAAHYVKTIDTHKNRREESRRRSYATNWTYYCARAAARRSKARKATPGWLTTEQRREIQAIYARAREITEATSIRHEVDHIIPLQGKTVCGLHVPWNLRVLPAAENTRKGSAIPPDSLSQVGLVTVSSYFAVVDGG